MLQQTRNTECFQVDRLQSAAFGYFLRYSDPDTGLVADTSLADAPSSIAATGFGLSCYPVGVERSWISRTDAAGRVLTALRFFANSRQGRDPLATGYRGFYYHFLHMKTGERVWQCELSTIDTALLMAGVLTAAAYFSGEDAAETEIRTLSEALYSRVDWHWALGRGETLTMGWRPPGRFLKYRWQGYSEALLLYVLALGAPHHAIRPEHYRAFTAAYDWTTVDAMPHLPAAPLFIHLFPQAWLDLRGLRDQPMREKATDYFDNSCRAISLQRRYADDNPGGYAGYGRDIWGLSACDGPTGRLRLVDGRWQQMLGYAARGAPGGPDDGTLAPWAAVASLPFDADGSRTALAALESRYPDILCEGRFPGGFNPSLPGVGPEGWVDDRVVGLDQGLVVMMIENARNGFVWGLMRDIPAIRRGLQRADFRGGWLDSTEMA